MEKEILGKCESCGKDVVAIGEITDENDAIVFESSLTRLNNSKQAADPVNFPKFLYEDEKDLQNYISAVSESYAQAQALYNFTIRELSKKYNFTNYDGIYVRSHPQNGKLYFCRCGE